MPTSYFEVVADEAINESQDGEFMDYCTHSLDLISGNFNQKLNCGFRRSSNLGWNSEGRYEGVRASCRRGRGARFRNLTDQINSPSESIEQSHPTSHDSESPWLQLHLYGVGRFLSATNSRGGAFSNFTNGAEK